MTIPMKTSSSTEADQFSKPIAALYVIIDIARAIISLVILFITCKMTSNESFNRTMEIENNQPQIDSLL